MLLQSTNIGEEKMKTKKIRITNALPSFICPFTYQEIPPLDVGEIIELPSPVSDLIVRKGRAKEVKVVNAFAKWENGGEKDNGTK